VTVAVGSALAPHSAPAHHPDTLGGQLELPTVGAVAERLLAPATLRCIVEAAIEAWRPVWGAAVPQRQRKGLSVFPGADGRVRAEVGWLTYLAVPPARLPLLPPPAAVAPVADGSLIIAVPGAVHADDPARAASIDRTQAVLDEAGLTDLWP
jgi:hypothetical protein